MPDGLTSCDLYVRRKIGVDDLEPVYSCVGAGLPVAEGKALYERHLGELRACFGGVAISEERSNEETGIPRHWQWTARTADCAVEISMWDTDTIINPLLGRPTGEPRMNSEIHINNLSPPRPGAVILVIQ